MSEGITPTPSNLPTFYFSPNHAHQLALKAGTGYGFCVTVDDRWEQSWRKVRTPYGSIPCRTRGKPGPKSRLTDSVAENRPPWSQDRGKGEKAG